MVPEQIVGFLIISAIFIAIPGPNILVIVSTSLMSGRTRGLQTVAGTASAMVIQLVIAAIATTSLLVVLNEGLRWLKWLGVSYLMFLGLRALFHFWKHTPPVVATASGSFQRGFLTSLTNPKTILFFSAFLPQFISTPDRYLSQYAVLAVCFLLLACVIDSTYAFLASRASHYLSQRAQRANRIQNGLSGALYIAASAFLAATNRT